MNPSASPINASAPEPRRHSALVRLLRGIHAASTADRPRAAVSRVLTEVCTYMGWPLGHAYVFDRAAGVLKPTNVWCRPDDGRHRALIEATRRTRLAPNQGLPGRAAVSRRAEWVTHLAEDVDSPRAMAAREAGIDTGVALPVPVDGEIVAVLEFFTEDALAPDRDLLAVLDYVGVAWSRVLEVEQLEVELTHSEERYQALVESAADGIIVADENGRIASFNPAATRMFGYQPDEVVGEPLTLLMPEPYRERHLRAFDLAKSRAPEQTGGTVYEFEGLARDGRVFPIELSLTSWSTDRRYFAGIMRDITVRRAAEEELRLLGSATAHVQEAIVVSTAGNQGQGPTILYVNAAFVHMTGFSEAEILGRSFSRLAGDRTDRDVIGRMHHRMRRGEAAAAELTAYRKDASEFLLDWHASPIYDANGAVLHYASILRDITEERRVEQALRRADRDPLTGLATREVLERRLTRAIDRAATRREYRFALLFMDLDGFKAVNDEHGHITGDQLLASAARRLEGTVRPGDTLARFGGDEFVVLLDSVTDIEDVLLVADRIRTKLRSVFDIGGREMSVAASIGIALSETGYSDPSQAIRDADAAMYEAKRKGKGRVEFFDSTPYHEIVSSRSLREDLAQALDRGELEIDYQPLVHLATRDIIGFEALVRWNHRELGRLPPDRFIPLAEQSGLIVPIGRWVLRTACHEASGWQTTQAGTPTLSVNLSVRELADPGLVESVEQSLEESGLDPARLQLELTESIVVDSFESVHGRIAELRRLGVTVCIDDFGTGYSSLGYLHHLPVDKIKIDRVFLSDIESTPGKLEILRTILSLAATLHLEVVAEGVETDGQLAHLRDLACGFGQGFLFSKPVGPAEVTDLLRNEAARH